MQRDTEELEKEQLRLSIELNRVTNELRSARISETGLNFGDTVIAETGEKCKITDFRFSGNKPSLVVIKQRRDGAWDPKETVLLIGWKPAAK